MAVRHRWLTSDATLLQFWLADAKLKKVTPTADVSPTQVADALLDSVRPAFSVAGRLLERIGPALVVLALVSWHAPGVVDHPGYLGIGGLAAVVATWALTPIVLRSRSTRLAAAATLLLLTLPVWAALDFPGPDIGLPLPPLWLLALPAFAAGCSYFYGLARLSAANDTGVGGLELLWRASGVGEKHIRQMSDDLSELDETRRQDGRGMSELDWMEEGLVIDLPEETDPNRHWRLLGYVIAAAVALVSIALIFDGAIRGETTGVVDGNLIRLTAILAAAMALPGIALLRRGRWVVASFGILALSAFFLVPRDAVLAEIHLFWVVPAGLAAVVVLSRRGWGHLREILDRFL